MSTTECPLVIAFNQIREVGDLNVDADDDNTIKIGGGDIEIVFNESAYYLAHRKIMIARASLQSRDVFPLMYPNKTASIDTVMTAVIRASPAVAQARGLYTLIEGLCAAIVAKTTLMAARGLPINITIPHMIEPLQYVSPASLYEWATAAARCINQLNLSSVSAASDPIGRPPAFPQIHSPAHVIVADVTEGITAEEKMIADYVKPIELYHTEIALYLDTLFIQCKKMIAALMNDKALTSHH